MRTNGATINGKRTPEHGTWHAMIQRCTNPNSSKYKSYGARGITICERWRHSFENFLADMGTKPTPQHTIERIDNNKGYEPSNCKWATNSEQQRNTTRTRMLTLNGVTMCMTDWATHLGVPADRLKDRLNKLGWSVERTLTTPRLRSGTTP